MRPSWTNDEAAPILKVHPSKVSQAMNPALVKIAKLWRADPTKTMIAIFEALGQLEPLTERINGTGDEMPNVKFQRLYLMQTDRLPRGVIHPKAKP